MAKVKIEIRENTYYDSVTLMLISKEVKNIDGVYEALVGMGTDLNKELVENLGIGNDEIKNLGPNDFFVSVLADENVKIETISREVDRLLSEKSKGNISDYKPPTLSAALRYDSELNMALISVAGEYAGDEAKKALENNLHVMVFSDNVTIEKEKELKELAFKKGLLMMGPDCGTAIINNVPLAFANVVKKGSIGIVGASGTGIQEVTVIIDKLGEGVSQVIGTGGRDLSLEIGGLMMLQGIEALQKDSSTEVIVLISKSPSRKVAEKILESIKDSIKPIVVHFLGGDREFIEKYGAYSSLSLEDAAYKAVAILRNEDIADYRGFSVGDEVIDEIVNREVEKLEEGQKYFRGLYTGGTLADEAIKILNKDMDNIYSNISLSSEMKLENVKKSKEHTCIDFGEDEFTVGRPHPMIDPSSRFQRLIEEGKDEEVAIILMDFVLGYGAHEDPVGEMLPAIIAAKESMAKKGKHLCIISSICGTEKDPQNLEESQKRLEKAGVIVMPSNAQAVRLSGFILNKIKEGKGGNYVKNK